MERTRAGRMVRSWRMASWLLSATIVFLSSFVASASAAPTPAASPCQPWGDETTEGADLWAEVGARVPTFAGLYVNEDTRTLYVLLTDQGQSLEEAVHAIQTIIRSHVFCEYAPVARAATYSYSQLKAWDDRISEVLSIPGTVSSGIDEVNNRLEVGVEDLAEQGPIVEAKLADLGVPREVAHIVQEQPPEFLIEERWPWTMLVIAIGLVLAVVVFVVFFAKLRKKASHEDRSRAPVSCDGD
ncbi:MAG: hypothetical protein ACRDHO_00675 [Actinomycetota bacterium]